MKSKGISDNRVDEKSGRKSEAEASEDESYGDYEYHDSDIQEWRRGHTFMGFQGGYEQWGERIQEENGVPQVPEQWSGDTEGENKEWGECPASENGNGNIIKNNTKLFQW